MKTTLIIIAILILSSCTKTYNCECQTLDKSTSKISKYNYGINAKKYDAIAECDKGDEESQSFYKDCEITNQ